MSGLTINIYNGNLHLNIEIFKIIN